MLVYAPMSLLYSLLLMKAGESITTKEWRRITPDWFHLQANRELADINTDLSGMYFF